MKNFKFSRFILFLLVVAVGLLAPSCNHSITTTRKADIFNDFEGLKPLSVEPRYASAELATGFEGILLTVFENGKYYQLHLCYVRYGRQTWFDENDGKWVGVTYFDEENGYTYTDFHHNFKGENDLCPTPIRTIHTSDLLVCSGGDSVGGIKVIRCKNGNCLVEGSATTVKKEKLCHDRLPKAYWPAYKRIWGEQW